MSVRLPAVDVARARLGNIYYGWPVLGTCALSLFLSGPAQTYGISVYIDPLIADTGWSRSLVSSLFSVATLCGSAIILLAGRQIDTRGSRSVMFAASCLFVAGLFVASIAFSPAILLMSFILMRGFGSGSLGLASKTLIPHWFTQRRGRAFSVLALSGVLSQAFFPPFGNYLVEHFGWREAWRFNAVFIAAILLPMILLVVRDRPRPTDIETLAKTSGSTNPEPRHVDPDIEPAWTLRQATRNRTFWLLIGAGLVPPLVGTGLAFNQVSILTTKGISSSMAAATFTIAALVAMPTTLLSGWLTDRFRPRLIMAGSQSMLAMSLLVLLFANVAPLVAAYAVLRGISVGLWVVAVDVIWPNYFGKRNLGAIRSATIAVGIAGAAIGPLPLSFAFDLLDSYQAAIAGMILLPVLSTVAVLSARPPNKPKPMSPTVPGASN